MSELGADYELARERQEASAAWWRERAAELHRWFQGGPYPSPETMAWAKAEITDTYNVRALMTTWAEHGRIPPPTEESIAKAQRQLADLGLEPWASARRDGKVSP